MFFESVNLDLFLVSEMLGTDLFKTCIFKQMIIKADDKLIDNNFSYIIGYEILDTIVMIF